MIKVILAYKLLIPNMFNAVIICGSERLRFLSKVKLSELCEIVICEILCFTQVVLVNMSFSEGVDVRAILRKS